MTIGAKIKNARLERKLTQKQLAEMLGVAVSTLSKYEKGDRTPKPEDLKKIEKILDIELLELMKSKVVLADFKNTSARVSSIPKSWLNELGIDEDNRRIELSFDKDKIIIKKLKG